MTWRYFPSSGEIIASDGVLIARDVPEEFGALLAAAGEMREVLQLCVPVLSRLRFDRATLDVVHAILAKTGQPT